jgi:hypothetical protein
MRNRSSTMACVHHLGHVGRLEHHTGGAHHVAAQVRAEITAVEHVGVHALRTQTAHLHAPVAVGDLNHSANATAACLVIVYGADPIWASRPAADAVEQK